MSQNLQKPTSTEEPLDVLFVIPRFDRNHIFGFPLGVAYLGAALSDEQHLGNIGVNKKYSWGVLDITAEIQTSPALLEQQLIEDHIKKHRPKIVGISANAATYEAARRAIGIIDHVGRQIGARPIIVVGGPLVSVVDEYENGKRIPSSIEVLSSNSNVDACVIGEGEVAFPLFVDACLGSTNHMPNSILQQDDIRTNAWINKITSTQQDVSRNSSITFTSPSVDVRQKFLKNPAIAKFYNLQVFGDRDSTTIFSSRGCPFSCSFCSSREIWGPVRFHPYEDVVEQIAALSQTGVKGIFFEDDTMTLNKKRMLAIAELITHKKKQGYIDKEMIFGCGTRVETFDAEIMKQMFSAGFRYVYFGFETADEQIRRNIGKIQGDKSLNDSYAFAIKHARDIGYTIELSLQFGLPGETLQTALETVRWVARNKPTEITVNFSTLYPGARLTHEFARGLWHTNKKCVTTRDYERLPVYDSLPGLKESIHGISGVLSPIVTPTMIEHVFLEIQNSVPEMFKPGACYRRSEPIKTGLAATL